MIDKSNKQCLILDVAKTSVGGKTLVVNEEGRCDSNIVVGALYSQPVDQKLHSLLQRIRVNIKVEHLQKTKLLRTARILRKVLEN